jgi:hypothetical protein
MDLASEIARDTSVQVRLPGLEIRYVVVVLGDAVDAARISSETQAFECGKVLQKGEEGF